MDFFSFSQFKEKEWEMETLIMSLNEYHSLVMQQMQTILGEN